MIEKRPHAAIVVLGDIGRSPRMCYHAHSLSTELNYRVTMFGYLDSIPHKSISDNEHISIVKIPAPPEFSNWPNFLQMLAKFIWTLFFLSWSMFWGTLFRLDLVLCQNPPAIPTMFVCWIISRLNGAKFVIDWHNYMYTVLQDKYERNATSGKKNKDSGLNSQPVSNGGVHRRIVSREDRMNANPVPVKKRPSSNQTDIKQEKPERKASKRSFVDFVAWWEGYFGRRADASLCVTKAMREDLGRKWSIPSAVFYDRPPSWTFGKVTELEKHELFMRLGNSENGAIWKVDEQNNSNAFTQLIDGKVEWKEDRPFILMSSTSWTQDEDFGILLDAVSKYNEIAKLPVSNRKPENIVPQLLLIITGKGPMKEFYLKKIAKMRMETVQVLTPWLEAEDYPKMLAAADLGVSLHTSTSALDLPMKVVDMFGSGLPVLAKRFACIHELVEDGRNGFLFDNYNQLADLIQTVATGFPQHSKILFDLNQSLAEEEFCSWEENWRNNVRSIVEPVSNIHLQRILASRKDSSEEEECN